MTQLCYGCAYGLTGLSPTLVPSAANVGDILGVCWECGVLGCYEHAERDATSGKWRCFASIANALFDSSQQDQATAPLPSDASQSFADSADFQARFPELALASEPARLRFRENDRRLSRILENAGRPADYRALELLADSLGVADFVIRGTPDFRPKYLITTQPYEPVPAPEQVARAVLIRSLAEALGEGLYA
jgi:hypothetical protein